MGIRNVDLLVGGFWWACIADFALSMLNMLEIPFSKNIYRQYFFRSLEGNVE